MVIFTVRKLHANSPVNRQIQQQTCLHTTEKVRNPAGKCLLFNPLWLFKFVKRATCHMCWVYAFLFLAVRLCCLTRAHLQHMFSNWWRCFLNMLFFFFLSRVALSGGGLSSLHRRANCPFPFLSHEPTNRTWKAESSQQKAQYETNVTYNCREVMYSGRDTENKGFCQNPLLSR